MDQSTESLCPGCFADKGQTNPCPHCCYDEEAKRDPLILLHRTKLHGRYLVGRVLGKPGGFGITYLGWDLDLQTRVAIKEYLPRDLARRSRDQATVAVRYQDDGELFRYGLEQFLREARSLAQLHHTNIVRVHHFFEANGTAYLVMDYYQGLSLAAYLEQRDRRIPEEQAKQLMLPIMDGLRVVHAEGLLHQDIKPWNIYLTDLESGGMLPVLLDFGAARQAIAERSGSLLEVLTPGYAACEQYQRKGQQGPWTDVCGAAAVLYRLVTGKVPPEANEHRDEDKLKPAAAFGVSQRLSDALAAGLALAVTERPQTVQDFQMRLWGNGPQPPSADPQPTARSWPAALGIILILLGLGVWGWYLVSSDLSQNRRDADDRAFAAARDEDTDHAYQGYLDNYCSANGCGHSSEANQRLRELLDARKRQAADDSAFTVARGADTDRAYQAYLDNCTAYGCGHSPEANERLKELNSKRQAQQADLFDYATAERLGTAAAFRNYLAICAANGCFKRTEALANLDRLARLELIIPALVRVEAGSFSMGCQPGEKGCNSDERDHHERPHQVRVSAFELGKYEVTLAQFRAFVDATGYQTEAERGEGCYLLESDIWTKRNTFSWRNVGFAQSDDSPVVCVSWNDAQAYVAWLSQKTGQTWRLPSEAEWEYAARAGTQTPYSTGTCISTDQANYNGKNDYNYCLPWYGVNHMRTQAVGQYPANPWGIYDMHGNVWEWVEDCYHINYNGAPTDGRAWRNEVCHKRVNRGGSWYGEASKLRSANRDRDETSSRYNTLGFRVARTITP